MKKSEIIFSIIKVPLDFLFVFLSFFVAREIRLITDLIPWVVLPIKTIETQSLIYFALFWWLLYIFILASHNLYKIKISNSKLKEILWIIRYWIYAFIFFSVFAYLSKWFIYDKNEIPRLVVLYSFIIATLFNIIHRIILNKIQDKLIDLKIIPKINILLISKNWWNWLKNILKDIKDAWIYKIIWYVNKEEKKQDEILKYLWWIDKIKYILEEKNIDEILFIDSDFSQDEIFEIWELSKIFWIRYRYITNIFDITKLNTELTLINNIPVIEIKNTSLENWGRVIKRVIDFIWSIFLIIIFSPLMVIIAILIKFEDSKWPIIYKNKRVWQRWKEFNLFKFRYLKWKYCIKDSYWITPENDKALEYEKKLIEEKSTRNWPLYKIKNDPRITKVWKFIEKYSLDELPQFFNVFIWNMSLVWPRPHQPREVENYEFHHKRVLTIKPWITWMAQVNWRENNSFEDEIKLDTFYIENWTFLLDLKILFKTFWSILKR